MNEEHKHKDKDEYNDNDKDKDAERTTESLTVCYIFGILMTQAFQVWSLLPLVNLLIPLIPLNPFFWHYMGVGGQIQNFSSEFQKQSEIAR